MSKTRTYRKKRGGQGFFQPAPPQATLTNVSNSAYQTGDRIRQGLANTGNWLSNWWNNLGRPNNDVNNQYGGRRRKTRKARKQ
jgi:hypothetical protein